MTYFTPGPWMVARHTKRISVVNPNAQHSGSQGGGGKIIVYTPVVWDSAQAPTALANANLIAAAPELFEALTDIRNRILCPETAPPSPSQILEIASAALTKARGTKNEPENRRLRTADDEGTFDA